MKIKKEIHWFSWDDAGGTGVAVFGTEAEQLARMRQAVRDSNWPELAEEMDRVQEGDDWSDLWEQFTEPQQYNNCYYNHGCDTVEIEITAADLKEHPYAVALRSIADGSDHTGRWLDADGCCPAENEDDPEFNHGPGYTWTEYNEEEQAEWLESIPVIARDALATP